MNKRQDKHNIKEPRRLAQNLQKSNVKFMNPIEVNDRVHA